ncbi:MAG: hypothetical protein H6760_00875 [Candidatus Nomurabacteria bacterium]|nr:MAG: hypothetical protein H6760_00875 [Candidatus Nomurabacteria bacterium]
MQKHQFVLIFGTVLFSALFLVSSALPEKGYAATPFGGNSNKRLSIYNGTLLLDGSAQLRLGNAGRDIQASGTLYLRPDGSARGSFFSGVTNDVGQRLSLTGGISGSDTIQASWIGTNGVDETRGAVTGYFHGAPDSAVGAAIFGEVQSCGVGQTCYAGYFAGGQSTGVQTYTATNPNGGATPALQVLNADANGVAASFTGNVQTNRLILDNNTRSACTWESVSGAELVCPSGKLLAGVRASNTDPVISDIYCCEL